MSLCIIIPVFNEKDVIVTLLERMLALKDKLPGDSFCLFVDDGSSDGSFIQLRRACEAHPGYFKLLKLTRNFGHQAAISAGIDHAVGDFVAVIDADLQDPPEILPEMLSKMGDNFDVIYGVRTQRKETFLKRWSYSIFYRTMAAISKLEIPLDAGDFCIMRSDVVNIIKNLPETNRFLRGLRAWTGFRQAPYVYSRAHRHAGQSKYGWSKLFLLAADGIFSFSELPLRLSSVLGGVIAVFSLFYFVFTLFWTFSRGVVMPGITTIASGLFLLGGVQLISIGILGEYVSRIYNETKRRPLYVVGSRINI